MSEEPNKEQQAEEDEEDVVSEELRKLNKSWHKNPYLIVASLILGPATFVGAFFIDFDSVYLSILQTIIFLISAGFFVILFSYGFNQLWFYSQKKKTNRELLSFLVVELGAAISLIINAVEIIPLIKLERSENSSVFLILTIIYFIISGILLTVAYFTFKKLERPIDTSDYNTFMIALLIGAVVAVVVYFAVFYFDLYSINHVFG